MRGNNFGSGSFGFREQEEFWQAMLTRKDGNVSVGGVVLGAIAIAGVLAVGLAAPNALKLLGYAANRQARRGDKKYIDTTLKRLLDQKCIRLERRNNHVFYTLTEKGTLQLVKLKLASGMFEKPKRWDGKWRIVTYDISEKRRPKRILLLRALGEAGFYHLQDSLWVYPYPCRELELLLKFQFTLGKEVLYIEGAEIELEPKLLRHFGLVRE